MLPLLDNARTRSVSAATDWFASPHEDLPPGGSISRLIILQGWTNGRWGEEWRRWGRGERGLLRRWDLIPESFHWHAGWPATVFFFFFTPTKLFIGLNRKATSFGRGGRQTPTCASRGNSSEIKELFVALPALNELRRVSWCHAEWRLFFSCLASIESDAQLAYTGRTSWQLSDNASLLLTLERREHGSHVAGEQGVGLASAATGQVCRGGGKETKSWTRDRKPDLPFPVFQVDECEWDLGEKTNETCLFFWSKLKRRLLLFIPQWGNLPR